MGIDEPRPNLLAGDARPFASRGSRAEQWDDGPDLSSGLSRHCSPPSAQTQARQPLSPRTPGDD